MKDPSRAVAQSSESVNGITRDDFVLILTDQPSLLPVTQRPLHFLAARRATGAATGRRVGEGRPAAAAAAAVAPAAAAACEPFCFVVFRIQKWPSPA